MHTNQPLKDTKMKPRVIVLSGYGLNCEEETKFAFEKAGAKSDIVHINDLIEDKKKLNRYQILAIPGGFAYGDDTGSGNAYAHKLKNHLWESIDHFLKRDTLTIGICNGFQILVNLGILGKVALLPNTNGRYTVRWVDLEIINNTPWFSNIDKISLPIAHGEGRFFASIESLQKLEKKKLIAAKYIKGEICLNQNLPSNSNGALFDIAAVTDKTGRILGMMPHPERAQFFSQLPNWTLLKEQYIREGKKIPEDGPGLKIFQNAVKYFN